MSKLSAERLAEIAGCEETDAKAGRPSFHPRPTAECDRRDLLSHIAALQAEVDALAGGLTPAAKRVLTERGRQKTEEGWTSEHDDAHQRGEMAQAAACYAYAGCSPHPINHPDGPSLDIIRPMWPWSRDWWKPKSQRRNLERAGALIIAELERLDRAAGRLP